MELNAMNVRITDPTVPEKRPYPWIGVNNQGLIVGFDKPKCGAVLGKMDGMFMDYGLFRYLDSWLEDNFTNFQGEISLKN